MLSPQLMACSDNSTGENDQDTSTTVSSAEVSSHDETEETVIDDLPEMNYDGFEYMIYNINPESNDWFTTTFVTFEEDSGEPIPSAIFNRNIIVEDRFNVSIAESYQTADAVKKSIQSGDGGCDMVLLDGSDTITFIQQKYLHDLNTVNYLDFDKPYWDQNAKTQLTIAGKYYEAVGDFMTTHIDETIVMFFK